MPEVSPLPCRRQIDPLDDCDLNEFAKATGFLKRKPRKITPAAFVKAIMLAGAAGAPSFRSIAWKVGSLAGGVTGSPQNLHRRCDHHAVEFFEKVVAHALSRRQLLAEASGIFTRLLINDGSILLLADGVASHFPAVTGHGQDKAMLRLQLACDFRRGDAVCARLDPYSRTDATASADLLEYLEPGDLVLRDLGYYKAACFQKIDDLHAYYVSRIKSEVLVFKDDGTKLHLGEFLRHRKEDVVDQQVRLGAAGNFHTRLVALRVPQKIAEERRRKLREGSKRRGEKISDMRLALADWTLLITNLTGEQATAGKLEELYRLRWHVEIVFKTLKSNGCMQRLATHVSNPHHLRVLILGQILQIILNLRMWRELGRIDPTRPASLLKVAKLMQETLEVLWLPGTDDHAWQRHLRRLFYYCRYDKRSRRNLRDLCAKL